MGSFSKWSKYAIYRFFQQLLPSLAQFSMLERTIGSLALKKSLNFLLEFTGLVRFAQKSVLQHLALPSTTHLSSFSRPERADREPPLENYFFGFSYGVLQRACGVLLVFFFFSLLLCAAASLQRASFLVFLFGLALGYFTCINLNQRSTSNHSITQFQFLIKTMVLVKESVLMDPIYF